MSGGSWDYLCYKVMDAADRLRQSRTPLRVAFGEHLRLVGEALHDVEWHDSGDTGPEREEAAILKVLQGSKDAALKATVDELRRGIRDAELLLKVLGEGR